MLWHVRLALNQAASQNFVNPRQSHVVPCPLLAEAPRRAPSTAQQILAPGPRGGRALMLTTCVRAGSSTGAQGAHHPPRPNC